MNEPVLYMRGFPPFPSAMEDILKDLRAFVDLDGAAIAAACSQLSKAWLRN